MPLLSFLLVLAIPPLMVLVPSLGHPADASSPGLASVWMILLVEAVLVVGYALSRLERRRLDGGIAAHLTRSGRNSRRPARNPLLTGQ